jgi:hypothetical protein
MALYQQTYRQVVQLGFVAFCLVTQSEFVSAQGTPDLNHFFDEDVPEADVSDVPKSERPNPSQLSLPESLDAVPVPATSDEKLELSSWIRWLVLRNLPPSFEDNRKWDRHKDVFDGIDFRRDGWKIEAKRKSKSVKHGLSSRYYIEFVNPAEKLEVQIVQIDFPKNAPIRVVTRVVAPLKLFGRVSEWARDIQLISISTNATATIELNVTCDIQVAVNPLKVPPDVEFKPVVLDATVALREFDVDRISQIHGSLADFLGKGIRQVLDRRLEDYRVKLVEKMNSEIAKQQGKLKLSIQDWVQTSIGQKAK